MAEKRKWTVLERDHIRGRSMFYALPYILVVNSYLSQALLGFERNLTHLDGHIIELQRHGVTQPGNLISY